MIDIKCLVYSWNLFMIRPQKRLEVNSLERNESGLTLRNGVLREWGKVQRMVWKPAEWMGAR